MSIINIRGDEYAASDHLVGMMEKFEQGTKEHELARNCLAYIANKISARERSDRELKEKHKRLINL